MVGGGWFVGVGGVGGWRLWQGSDGLVDDVSESQGCDTDLSGPEKAAHPVGSLTYKCRAICVTHLVEMRF